jgi:hypothetical protein
MSDMAQLLDYPPCLVECDFPGVDDIEEQEMASNEKTRAPKQENADIASQLKDISTQLSKIETHLFYHRLIAGMIFTVFAGAFVWTLSFYIPQKINDIVPTNFKEDYGSLKQQIMDMQDRLNRLTPTSLDQLIPGSQTKISPRNIAARLQKASNVIDVALTSYIPASPGSLSPLLDRVQKIQESYGSDPIIRTEATSVAVQLSGYEIASHQILEGHIPSNESPVDALLERGATFIGFSAHCPPPPGNFFRFRLGDETVRRVVAVDVQVYTCSQQLDGPKWINDKFHGSKIKYNGGSLYLADVIFDNCTFEFGNDPSSRAVLAKIMASNGKPVNILIPE